MRNNRYSNHYHARSRDDFNIDTRTATEYGVVRTFFDAVFTWTSGTYRRGYRRDGTRPSARRTVLRRQLA